MNQPHNEILKTMGIDVYVRRDLPVEEGVSKEVVQETDVAEPVQASVMPQGVADPVVQEIDTPVSVTVSEVERMEWIPLRERVQACTACSELCDSRTQTVFGVGNQRAQLMVVGEAPGRDEDQQGEPFVGRAGQLLDRMLVAMGLQRQQVYIANVLKCRPPNDRDPKPEEAEACRAYLERQIALVQPKVVLSVGRISAQHLLRTEQAVGRLRGQVHTLEPTGVPLVVTYHPDYLLRQPSEKRKAWDDLQRAMAILN